VAGGIDEKYTSNGKIELMNYRWKFSLRIVQLGYQFFVPSKFCREGILVSSNTFLGQLKGTFYGSSEVFNKALKSLNGC